MASHSIKWIEEQANNYLDCLYPYGAKDRLAFARFNKAVEIISEFVEWMKVSERSEKMGKEKCNWH